MTYDPQIHRRRSIRLRGYDYSQEGGYFVTICTKDRACLFGTIVENKMQLNEAGRFVDDCWKQIPTHFPRVILDEHTIMPNHVHGIIMIEGNVGVQNLEPLQKSLREPTHEPPENKFQHIIPNSMGSIVRGFKIGVTKWFRQNTRVHVVWQRNFYEHIIRNDDSLHRIREYILYNPIRWATDRDNPNANPDETEIKFWKNL